MIKQIIGLAAIIFFIFFLLTYFWQRSLIYFPMKQTPERKAFQAEKMQRVELKTSDDLLLMSWYKPANASQATILYLHGNAGHIGYRVPIVQDYIAKGLGVFLLEYRGYGGNPGHPHEKGLYDDGRAALRYLHDQGIASDNIILFGESLGAGVATKLATEQNFCAVILQSPFTSLTDLARYNYPWAVLKPWDRYESLQRIASINAPLLILHGNQDRIVPFSHGQRLYKAAKHPKKLAVFEVGHNDIWQAEAFTDQVLSFIHRYCQ